MSCKKLNSRHDVSSGIDNFIGAAMTRSCSDILKESKADLGDLPIEKSQSSCDLKNAMNIMDVCLTPVVDKES